MGVIEAPDDYAGGCGVQGAGVPVFLPAQEPLLVALTADLGTDKAARPAGRWRRSRRGRRLGRGGRGRSTGRRGTARRRSGGGSGCRSAGCRWRGSGGKDSAICRRGGRCGSWLRRRRGYGGGSRRNFRGRGRSSGGRRLGRVLRAHRPPQSKNERRRGGQRSQNLERPHWQNLAQMSWRFGESLLPAKGLPKA